MAKFIELRALVLKFAGLAGIFFILSSAFSADSARFQSSGFRYSTYLNTISVAQNANNFHGSFIVQNAPTDIFSTTSHHIYEELSDEIQGMPIRNSLLGYLIDGKTVSYDYQTVWRTRGWNVIERTANNALLSASEGARRTGLLRTLEFDVQSELGGRSANVGINALGGFRETKEDVIAWQLRGYRTEDDTGANAGLIYRRATESNVLLGANVFIDYETADVDNFWRWSVGGELRSPWIDVFANRYEGITDPVVNGGIATYTADGYDIELNVHSPNIPWLTGKVTYYNWLGEFDDGDDEGVRFGLKFSPRQIPLVLEIEYEDADEGDKSVGGRISYTHEFGAPSARRGSRAEFRARDWFYAPVEREYTQRIRGDDNVGGYTRRITLASTVLPNFLVNITSVNPSLNISIAITPGTVSNTYIVSGTRDGGITLQPPILTITTDLTSVTAAVWDIPTEATIRLESRTPLSVSFARGAITAYIGSTVIMDRDSIGLIYGIITVVTREGFSGEFMAFQGSVRASIQNGVIMRSGGEQISFRHNSLFTEITLTLGNNRGFIVGGVTLSRSQTSCEAPDATIGITFRCPIDNGRFEINSAYANADTSLLNVSQRGNNAALITYLENLSPTSTPHFASVIVNGGSGNDITYSGSTSNLRVDDEGRMFLVDPSTNFPTGVTVVNAAITIVASDIVPEIDPLTTVFQVEVRSNALTPFTANLRGTGRSVPQNGNTETTPIGIRDARNGQLLALASISPRGGVGSIYEYRRLVGGSNSGNNTPINNLNVSSEGVISIPTIDEASGIVLNATLGITVEVRDMADTTDHTDNITLTLFVRLDNIRTDPLEINFTASDTYESSNGDFRYTASRNRIRVNYPYGGLRSQSGTEAHRTLGTFALAGGSGRTAARLEATAPSGLEASLSSDMKTLMLRLSGASTDTANYTFNISATDPIVSPIDASYEIQAVQDIGGVTDEKQPAIGNIIQGGGGNYRYFTELARRDSRSYPHTGIQLGEARGGSGSGYSSRLVSGAASGISYNSNTREITFSRLPAEGNYELVIEFSDRDRSLGANSHRVTIAIESTDDLVDVALYLPTDDARANRLNTINTNLGNVSETGRQVAIAELVEVTDGTLTQVSGELIFTANPDGMGGIITLPDDQVGTGVVVLDGDRSVVRHFIVLRARDNELNVQVDISINAELDFDEPVITISENTTYAGGDIRYNLDGGIGGANIRINYPNGGDWSQGVSAAQRQIAVLAGEATFEAGAHSSILESDSTGLRFVSATPPDDTTLPYTVTYEPVNSAIGITGRIVPVTVHGVENIEASDDSIVPAASAYVVGSNLSYRYIVPNVPSGGSRGIAINIGDFSGGSGEYRTRAVNVRTPLRFVDNSGSNALEFNGTFQAGQAYTAIIEISDANSNLGTLPYSVTIVVEAIDVLFEINSAYANADTSILNVVSQDGSIQALITYLENNSPRDDAHFASARVSGGSASGITYSGTSSNLQINANGEISLLDASTNFPPGVATMTAAITIVATDTLLSIPITTVFQVEVRANALTPFTANLSGTGRSIPANSNTETTPLGITDASNGQTLALARINPRGGVGSNYTYTRLVGGSNSGDNEPINNLNVSSEGVISIPIINEASDITLNATLGITVEVSDTADTSTRTPDGHTPNITLILFVRLDNIRTDPLQIDFTASPTYAGTTSDGEFRYTTTGNNIRINYPYNSTRRSQSTSDDHRNLGRVVMSGGSGRTAAQIQSNSILANIDTDIMNDTFLNIRIPDDTNVSTDRWTIQVTASDPVADNITAEYIVQAVRDVGGVTDSKDPAIGNVIQGGSGSYRYFTELASRDSRTYPHTGIQLSDAQGGSGSYSSSLVSGAASGISYNETNREITFASSPAVGNYELVIEFRDGGSLGANPHSVTIAIEATDNLVDVALFAPGDTTGTTRLNIINENLGLVSETGRNVARATLAEVTNGTLTKVDGGLDFTPDASGMGGIIALPDDQVGTGIIDLDRDVVLQSIVFEAIDNDNEVTVTISFIAELSFAEPVITISENSAYADGDIRYNLDGGIGGANIRINYPNGGDWSQGGSAAQRQIAVLAGEATFEAGAHSSILESDSTGLRFVSAIPPDDTTAPYTVTYEPVNSAIGITGRIVPVTVHGVENITVSDDSIVPAASAYVVGSNLSYRYIVPNVPSGGGRGFAINIGDFSGGSGEYRTRAVNVRTPLRFADNSGSNALGFSGIFQAGQAYTAIIEISDANSNLGTLPYSVTIVVEAIDVLFEINSAYANADTSILNVVSQNGSNQALITYLENNSPRDDAHFASARVSGGSASGITYSGTSSNLQINANGEISLLDASTNFPPGIATMTAAITIVATDTLLSIPITTVFQVEVRANALTPFTANLSGTGRSIPANSNTETTPLGITDASNGQTLALARINPRGGVGSNYTYTRLVGGSNSGDNEPINNLNVSSEGVISIPIINEASDITLNATLGITVEVSDTADTSTRTPDGHTPNITLILFVRLDTIRTDPLQIDFTASDTYASTNGDFRYTHNPSQRRIRVNYLYNATGLRSESVSAEDRELGTFALLGGSGRSASAISVVDSPIGGLEAALAGDNKTLMLRLASGVSVDTANYTLTIRATDELVDNLDVIYQVQAVRDVGGVTDSKDSAIGNIIQGSSGRYRYFTELARRDSRTYPHAGITLSDADGGSGSYSSRLVSGAASGISYNSNTREITFSRLPAESDYELVIAFSDSDTSLGANPHSVTIAIEATDDLVDVALFAPSDTTGANRLNSINATLGPVAETGRDIARATLAEVDEGTLTKVSGGLIFTADADRMGGIIALPDDQVGTGGVVLNGDNSVVRHSITFEAVDINLSVTVILSFVVDLSFAEPVIDITENPTYAGGDIRYNLEGGIGGANIRVNYPNGSDWSQGSNAEQRQLANLEGEATFGVSVHSSILQSDNTALRFVSATPPDDTTLPYTVSYEPLNSTIGITGSTVYVTVIGVEDIGATDSVAASARDYISGIGSSYRYVVPVAVAQNINGRHVVVQVQDFNGGSGEGYTSSAQNMTGGLAYDSTTHQLSFTSRPSVGQTYTAEIVVSDTNINLEAVAYTTTITIETIEVAVETAIINLSDDTVVAGVLTQPLGHLTLGAVAIASISITDPLITNVAFVKQDGGLDVDSSGLILLSDNQIAGGVIDYEANIVRQSIIVRVTNNDNNGFTDIRLSINLTYTDPVLNIMANTVYADETLNLRYNFPYQDGRGITATITEGDRFTMWVNYPNGVPWARSDNGNGKQDRLLFRLLNTSEAEGRVHFPPEENNGRRRYFVQQTSNRSFTFGGRIFQYENAGPSYAHHLRTINNQPDDATGPETIRLRIYDRATGIETTTITIFVHAVEDIGATISIVEAANEYLLGDDDRYAYVVPSAIAANISGSHAVLGILGANGGSGEGYTYSVTNLSPGLTYDSTTRQLSFSTFPTEGQRYTAIVNIADTNSALEALPFLRTIVIDVADAPLQANIINLSDSTVITELTRILGDLSEPAVNVAQISIVNAAVTNVSFAKQAGGLGLDANSGIISIPDNQIASGVIDYDAGIVRHSIVIRAINNDNNGFIDMTLNVDLTFDEPFISIVGNTLFTPANGVRYNFPQGLNIAGATLSGSDRVSIRINYSNGGNWATSNSRADRYLFTPINIAGRPWAGRVYRANGTIRHGIGPTAGSHSGQFFTFRDTIAEYSRPPIVGYGYYLVPFANQPDDTTEPERIVIHVYDNTKGIESRGISIFIHAIEDIAVTDSIVTEAASYMRGENSAYIYNTQEGASGVHGVVNIVPNGGSGDYAASAQSLSDSLSYDTTNNRIQFTETPAAGTYTAVIAIADADSNLGATPYTTTIVIRASDVPVEAAIVDLSGGAEFANNLLTRVLGDISESAVEIAEINLIDTSITNFTFERISGSLLLDTNSGRISIPDDQIAGGVNDREANIIQHFINIRATNTDTSETSEYGLTVNLTYDDPSVGIEANRFYGATNTDGVRANFPEGAVDYTEGTLSLRINYSNGGVWSRNISGSSNYDINPFGFTSSNSDYKILDATGNVLLDRNVEQFPAAPASKALDFGNITLNAQKNSDGDNVIIFTSETPPDDTTAPYIIRVQPFDFAKGIAGSTVSVIIYAIEDIGVTDSVVTEAAAYVGGSNSAYTYSILRGTSGVHDVVNVIPNGGSGDYATSAQSLSDSLSYDTTNHRIQFTETPTVGTYTAVIAIADADSSLDATPYTTTIVIRASDIPVDAELVGLSGADVINNVLTRALGDISETAVEVAEIRIIDFSISNFTLEKISGSLLFDANSGRISIPDDQFAGGVDDREANIIQHVITIRATNTDTSETTEYGLTVNLTYDDPAVVVFPNGFYGATNSEGVRATFPANADYTEGTVSLRINYNNGGIWSRIQGSDYDRIIFGINSENYKILDATGNVVVDKNVDSVPLNPASITLNFGNITLHLGENSDDSLDTFRFTSETPPDDTTAPYIIRVQPFDFVKGIAGSTVSIVVYAIEDIAAPVTAVAAAAAYLSGDNGNYNYIVPRAPSGGGEHAVVRLTPNGGRGEYVVVASGISSGWRYDATTHQIFVTSTRTIGDALVATIVIEDIDSGFETRPYTTTISINATDFAVRTDIINLDDNSDITGGHLIMPLGNLTLGAVDIAEARIVNTRVTNFTFSRVAGSLEIDATSGIISIPDDQFAGGILDYDALVVRHFITIRATNDDSGEFSEFGLSVDLTFTQPQLELRGVANYGFNRFRHPHLQYDFDGIAAGGVRTLTAGGTQIRIFYADGGSWSNNNNSRRFVNFGNTSSDYRILDSSGNSVADIDAINVPGSSHNVPNDDGSASVIEVANTAGNTGLQFLSITPPGNTETPYVIRVQPYHADTGLNGFTVSITVLALEDIRVSLVIDPRATAYVTGSNGNYIYDLSESICADNDGCFDIIIASTPHGGSGNTTTSPSSPDGEFRSVGRSFAFIGAPTPGTYNISIRYAEQIHVEIGRGGVQDGRAEITITVVE